MKHLALTLLAALAVASSCTRDDDTPAPARQTRTFQTVTVTAALSPSTIPNDTTLQNPQVQVFVLTPTVGANGALTYPATSGSAAVAPVATFTSFGSAQTFTLPAQTIADGPNTGLRLVLTSANRPGRRANSQRLTASVVVGGGTPRLTVTHTGTNFSRTAQPTGGLFTTASETSVASYQ